MQHTPQPLGPLWSRQEQKSPKADDYHLPFVLNFFQQGGEEGQKAMPWTPKFRRGAMEMDRERSHCLWILLAKGLHLGSCCLSSTSGGGEWKLPTAKHHDPPLPSPGPRVKLPGHQAVPDTYSMPTVCKMPCWRLSGLER
nr:uncharacterized protein LOC129038941 [Pongo pygmaeus]